MKCTSPDISGQLRRPAPVMRKSPLLVKQMGTCHPEQDPCLRDVLNLLGNSTCVDAGIAGDAVQAVWVGHATCLVQLDGVTFLTDPVLSERCSGVQARPCRGTDPSCPSKIIRLGSDRDDTKQITASPSWIMSS